MRIVSGDFESLLQCIEPYKNIWVARWDKEVKEEGGYQWKEEVFDHLPSVADIKDAIFTAINDEVTQTITSGFKFKDQTVWLSTENQANYKSYFDLGLTPTIKIGDSEANYYSFQTKEEFTEFYKEVVLFIQNTIKEGWDKKDAIDFSEYETLIENATK